MSVLSGKGGEGGVDLASSSSRPSESEDEVESGLLLNIVVAQSSVVFELFACEDESLLVWGDSLLVLDLCLDVVDGVCWLDIKSDGLAREGLHENLHIY